VARDREEDNREEAMTGEKAALLIVDVQKDFCPGGALAAPGGDDIIPALNRYLVHARERDMVVYASRDWHPPITSHFKEHGGEWPRHCVQGTAGAQFHGDLKLPADTVVISKGDDPARPGYSAFDGHTVNRRTLLHDLRDRHITRLYVAGIATDYCVKATALDAVQAGLQVHVLRDAITGIDVHPGDAARALEEMSAAGAQIVEGLGTGHGPTAAA
jgi:nicotinamidase/pyrazinamidase